MKTRKPEPFFYFAAGEDFAVFIAGVRAEKALVPVFMSVWIIVQNNPVSLGDPTGETVCGSLGLDKLIPDTMKGLFDFTAACGWHDACYGRCGEKKSYCDKIFHGHMLRHCRTRPHNNSFYRTRCEEWADKYYQGVKTGGHTAYIMAQAGACLNKYCWPF